MPFPRRVVTLIAEDDPGHTRLIEKNLARSGLQTPILKFENGQQVLDFLFCRGSGEHRQENTAYLLLLDINLPKVSGVEVLREMRADPEMRKIPVIMLTTTDDPREIDRCHALGCSSYVVKPISYDQFANAIATIGSYISLVRVPPIQRGEEAPVELNA